MKMEEIIKEVENLVKLWKNNNKLYDDLREILKIEPESPVLNRIDDNFNNYVRMVSLATGINEDALNWFIWEADCGQHKSECEKDGKKSVIKNVKTFVDFEFS